jgi:predicted ATPase
VCLVELSPVDSPQFLAPAITSAFRRPVRAQDPIPELATHLRGKRVLLVLDSCEHLIAEAARIAERLFREALDLYILATSREALRVEGEHIYLLPPLVSPPEDEKLTAAEALAYPAVQLFVNRIESAGFSNGLVDEDARIVSGMCRQLGGIALAIELAAGRVAAYGIRDTASLLNGQFALLWPGRRTAPPRQQTLNATLDWSYDLLSDDERKVFRQLSVFTGGFTLDAACRVVTGDEPGSFEFHEARAFGPSFLRRAAQRKAQRFARGDMRDHIVSHKNDHGASYWRYGILRWRSWLKINICEIFGVVRFSTLQQYRREAETDVVHAPKRQRFGCVIRQRSRADWLDFLP